MWLSDLVKSVGAVNQKRFPANHEAPTMKFKDMVEGWICGGASVAAIFSGSTFVSAYQSHGEAISKARAMRNSGIPDLKIKNVTIR